MEEKQRINYSTFVQAASAVVTAVALVLLMFGWLTPDEQEANQPEARGVTNFDSLTLGEDLIVGDDSTLTDDVAIGGDLTVTGSTSFTDDLGNTVNMCDATAADCKLQYDGNAQDFYLALDDSADDLLIGLGSTVGTTGIVFLDENQDVGLGGASAGAKLDVTGNQLVDGAADEVQLTVQGYTTQTNNIFVIEETGGTDLFWVDNNGDAELNGTTPALTIGDAGAEDTQITFDGNAQDFYIGLDDTADDLVVGLGSAVGTTAAFSVDENQVTTWVGGTLELAATTTTTDTLTASECGKTIFLNAAGGYQTTLPAISTVSAGCAFRFFVKAAPSGANYTIITGNSLENVLIGGFNELEVDTSDDGPYQAAGDTITFVDSVAVVGDYVYMISDGTSFYLYGQTQADGGVTIAQAD